MSKRIALSITKSNVLKMKEELAFAEEGYELLEQKREVLVMEVMRNIEECQRYKKEAEECLAYAYDSLKETYAILGKQRVEKAALSALSRETINIRDRGVMGIAVPIISYKETEIPCNQYGFCETSYCLDKTVMLFSTTLSRLATLAQTEVTLWKLAGELKKTQRRANALHNILIPEYKNTIKYLEDNLEEKEREELFQLKKVKKEGDHQ
ncbi:MAG: V-type ATP synthase subunit D [bacterium]